MKNIEKLYAQWRSMPPLDTMHQDLLDRDFDMRFNYNSNHLEGNTLTYGQTKLLLMFGETSGDSVPIRDYEEMQGHDVALKLIREEAMDKEKPLTEKFIRDLNEIILVRPFYKPAVTPDGSPARIKIDVGTYKTRPNHVVTPQGTIFYYASPQETPAMITSLVTWFNEQDRLGKMHPLELATLFHFRFIRIHPFEDGNGRISRLLTNYILLRNGYPIVIVESEKKRDYLRALHATDNEVGSSPSDGANAELAQITPFLNYMSTLLTDSLERCIKAALPESR
jgi:Fic family protein